MWIRTHPLYDVFGITDNRRHYFLSKFAIAGSTSLHDIHEALCASFAESNAKFAKVKLSFRRCFLSKDTLGQKTFSINMRDGVSSDAFSRKTLSVKMRESVSQDDFSRKML